MPHLPHTTPEDLFPAYLTAYRVHLQRIARVRKLEGIELQWSLQELQQAHRTFETQVAELRRCVDFSLPMQMALAWVRIQTFWMYRLPLVGLGWQQARQGFQHLYDTDSNSGN